ANPVRRARVVVIRAAEIAHDRLFRPALVAVEHIHVEAALLAHQRREEADRAGAGDEQYPRLPGTRPMADAVGMVPGLGKNAGRLEQDTENSPCRIDLDRELRLAAQAV